MDASRIKLVNRKLFACLFLAGVFYIIGVVSVVKTGIYSRKQFVLFLITFGMLCLSFIIGNYLKGLMPAVVMGTSFVMATLTASFLYDSGIVLLYLLVVLSIITSYQNKFLMYYMSIITFLAAFAGQMYGTSRLGWLVKDVGLIPFIVIVVVLAVFLSYRQISLDNNRQKELIMEKQKNAEESYDNLVQLSQVVSNSTSQLVTKARDNRNETQIVLQSVSAIVDGLANQNSNINMQVENSKIIEGKLEGVVCCVDDMNKQVDKVLALAQKSEKSMLTLNDNTERVSNMAMQSKNGIDQLLAHVISVQEVVGIITEVAEQTRLLSLNASIEAAKAGTYGNGFVVVAEEIRKLSDSTSDSVQKINDLLVTLQDKSVVVEKEIQEMNQAFNEQKREIQLTNGNMKDLALAMNSMRNGLDNVVFSTKEVVTSNEAVSKGVSNIADISEEIGATLDNVSEACKRVYDSSNETLNIAEDVENKAGKLM
ncbi:methyl-accepting chemotaxis protein [[Clostridium] polysaccharolyticum]|uniref:Methyl-accepting chemotaxis protein n=1 Tax=[Clostridium] polysaccharolyticum TaxID=29364 RepID=A0A1I0C8X0_9FIRM|nr:methyl-accepting chemotaxis protein [[Clostridium] polysaccharolyticum]SET15287.1 Methyl-accepting chemotaxis protein [[Clostridium] polysaccharolyticum]